MRAKKVSGTKARRGAMIGLLSLSSGIFSSQSAASSNDLISKVANWIDSGSIPEPVVNYVQINLRIDLTTLEGQEAFYKWFSEKSKAVDSIEDKVKLKSQSTSIVNEGFEDDELFDSLKQNIGLENLMVLKGLENMIMGIAL